VTTPTGDVRARRPPKHEALVQELRQEAGFITNRDVLLFAAAIGVYVGRRLPFTGSISDIRYETLTEPAFAGTLVSMIATCEPPENPEILDGVRLAERVKIFEEYANGGLEYIQEQINTRHQPIDQVVIALVAEALEKSTGDDTASVEELLSGVTW
jgi:dnd system-associated protein 4